jgi:hypothetical protein
MIVQLFSELRDHRHWGHARLGFRIQDMTTPDRSRDTELLTVVVLSEQTAQLASS